ncbi:hypothetical protein [Streptomyces variegatus]|jgi:hypothetical protein|uniref:hypothetical protein n=1 Tax=Streptomyces variegatus TaxID=284040 RepID=UPI003C2E6798
MRPTFLQLVRHGERARLKDPDERRVVDAESVAQRKNVAHGDRRGSHPGVDRKLDGAAFGPRPDVEYGRAKIVENGSRPREGVLGAGGQPDEFAL